MPLLLLSQITSLKPILSQKEFNQKIPNEESDFEVSGNILLNGFLEPEVNETNEDTERMLNDNPWNEIKDVPLADNWVNPVVFTE